MKPEINTNRNKVRRRLFSEQPDQQTVHVEMKQAKKNQKNPVSEMLVKYGIHTKNNVKEASAAENISLEDAMRALNLAETAQDPIPTVNTSTIRNNKM